MTIMAVQRQQQRNSLPRAAPKTPALGPQRKSSGSQALSTVRAQLSPRQITAVPGNYLFNVNN